jgi:hypothetical protein
MFPLTVSIPCTTQKINFQMEDKRLALKLKSNAKQIPQISMIEINTVMLPVPY